jgi:hypothetical protein
MVSKIEEKGLLFVGRDETGERMEVVELQENPSGHPFYVAAQVGCRVCAFGAVLQFAQSPRNPDARRGESSAGRVPVGQQLLCRP